MLRVVRGRRADWSRVLGPKNSLILFRWRRNLLRVIHREVLILIVAYLASDLVVIARRSPGWVTQLDLEMFRSHLVVLGRGKDVNHSIFVSWEGKLWPHHLVEHIHAIDIIVDSMTLILVHMLLKANLSLVGVVVRCELVSSAHHIWGALLNHFTINECRWVERLRSGRSYSRFWQLVYVLGLFPSRGLTLMNLSNLLCEFSQAICQLFLVWLELFAQIFEFHWDLLLKLSSDSLLIIYFLGFLRLGRGRLRPIT